MRRHPTTGPMFIVPGALVMIVLSWLYVEYGSLPQVNAIEVGAYVRARHDPGKKLNGGIVDPVLSRIASKLHLPA